jgi:hypothetical protein
VLPTIDGRQHELVRTVSMYERLTATDIEWIVETNHPNCGLAWNAGAKRATGTYLHITADDLEPETDQWLGAAIETTKQNRVPMGYVREGSQRFGRDFCRVIFCRREWWRDVFEAHYYTDNHFTDLMRRRGHWPIITEGFDFRHRKSMVGRNEERMRQDHLAYLQTFR